MFPIQDHNPARKTPYVTLGLIAVNVAVFLSYWPFLTSAAEAQRFFLNWGMTPRLIMQGGHWSTVITAMFMHAGWMHIIGNMLFLWIFGDNLEDDMGHVPFLLFYLACGVGAAFTHLLMAPHSMVPTVGASGAIAGVMGGYLLLYPRARVDVLLIIVFYITMVTLPAWTMLGFWFLMQFLSGLGADPNVGGVAYWAHTGGFLTGIVLTLPVWLAKGRRDHWRETDGRPQNPAAQYKWRGTDIPRVGRHTDRRRK